MHNDLYYGFCIDCPQASCIECPTLERKVNGKMIEFELYQNEIDMYLLILNNRELYGDSTLKKVKDISLRHNIDVLENTCSIVYKGFSSNMIEFISDLTMFYALRIE